MATLQQFVVPNVSPDQFAKLIDMIRSDGGKVTGDTTGHAENECFATDFVYDKDAGVLRLDPTRMVPGLSRCLVETVQAMIAPPAQPEVSAGETIYKPTPHSCATYNWVIGFFTNNSGGILTYSGQNTNHGNVQDVQNKIAAGATPDTYPDGFWTNKSPKDSTLGCDGSISFQLADGVTTVTVTYDLNTLSTQSSSVALSGVNAAKYSATVTNYDKFYYAAAYLYPYVTVTKL